jgi:class 3 adenylate cyclase
VRCGLHTAECIFTGARLSGIAVHIGARVAAAAAPGEVWLTETVKNLVAGSGIRFSGRGTHALKGVAGDWPLYAAP